MQGTYINSGGVRFEYKSNFVRVEKHAFYFMLSFKWDYNGCCYILYVYIIALYWLSGLPCVGAV